MGCSQFKPCENLSDVSRARKFCTSSPVLETFISLFVLSSLCPTANPTGTVYLIRLQRDHWLTLIGSSYFSRLVDWIIYTSPNRDWWSGQVIKDLFTDSLHKYWLYSTNMDSYILVDQAWKGLLIPALGQERTKVDRIIAGGILVKSKLAKCPWVKTAQESSGVVMKENKTHSFLYEIFTQVLCRKHRRF